MPIPKNKNKLIDALNRFSDKSPSIEYQYKKASVGNSEFASRLEGYVKEISNGYKDGMDLTQEVSKISEREGLSENEIDRLVQSVNMKIYQIMFDKTKGQDNRDVKFPIAKAEEVKRILGMSKKEDEEDSSDELPGDKTEKVASEKKTMLSLLEKSASDDREFFYNSAEIKDGYRDHLLEKVSTNLNQDFENKEKISKDLKDSSGILGVAFAKYASHGLNHQKIFDKMCSSAGLRKSGQRLVKEAFLRAGKEFKIKKEASINLADIDSMEDFSLGKHSISKVAEEEVASLPEVVDKKNKIRDFEKLVDLAVKIQEDEQMLNEINEKIETKKKIIEEAEKNKKIKEGNNE